MSASVNRFQYLPIIALALSMLVGGYFFHNTLADWSKKIVSDYMSRVLDDVAHQIHEQQLDLYDMAPSDIDAFIDNLSQSRVGQRLTIIHSSGKVLGDSQLSNREISGLDDHSTRAEVADALVSGIGISKRHSSSIDQDMLYVARKLILPEDEHGHDTQYVIRLAMPLTALVAMTSDLELIVYALMGASFAVLICSSWFSHRRIFAVVSHERQQQEERIAKSTREIELLHQLANMLAACNSIKEAQVVVADIIPRILGDINGCVSIMRESRNQLEVKLDWGGTWPASTVYTPNDCWALRKGKFHLSHEKHHHLVCNHMSHLDGDGNTLCVPLTAHGNTVGMFHLYFGQHSSHVSDETKQLAFTLAEHLGLALANLSLQEKLRSQAMRDPLTGLFNRRYFEEVFDREWSKAEQDSTQLSLLMLDLDHFKRFNDNFGHDAGDYVLKEVSSLLKQSITDTQVACRLGGEELAIICPDTPAVEALTLAEQIVESVRELHLDMKGLSLGQLGVSIGVTTYPELNASTAELVKAADTALYQAKDQGRSQAIHSNASQSKPAASVSDIMPLKS
ncbi:sensor domain-containing diguanylate cyclase [Vibrio brasiliensis]|uniref:sensor domain-containing diguanylate cyclase n=1 Tax=Vibrio brasiliensis TaxID=170652 RepID=UPI001EFDFDBA|nr:sensor domain-containing diguanylate cyclase [Vibrio brasiliensis]MCG9647938.1 sensor domain-containing diguanylate cyclase [Vibrio brasiliensis]